MKIMYIYTLMLTCLLLIGGFNISFASPLTTQDEIDLELTVTLQEPQYNILTSQYLSIELSNTGPSDASGIILSNIFSEPSLWAMLTLYVEATEGTFDKTTGIWMIDHLGEGETVYLNFVWMQLSTDPPIQVCAQVLSADQEDIDSSPSNNSSCIPFEDDEILTYLFAESLLTENGNPTANFNGPEEVSNVFDLDLVFSEAITGLEERDFILENGEIMAIEATEDQANYTITVRPILMGEIKISLPSNTVHDLDANPNDASNEWIINFEIGDEYVDLSLDLQVSDTEVDLGDLVVFTLEVFNDGVMDATNVIIDFDFDAEHPETPFVLVSQNVSELEYIPNKGIWQIDNIPVGESRILELVLSTKAEFYYTLFTEVLSADLMDIDSGYDNDFGESISEDDEAKVTIKIGGGGLRPDVINPAIPMTFTDELESVIVYPNPTSEVLHIKLESQNKNDVKLLIINYLGQVIEVVDWQLEKGFNQKTIPVNHLANGHYFISAQQKNKPLRRIESFIRN